MLYAEWVKVIDNVFYSATSKDILYEYEGETFNGKFIEAYYNCSTLNLSSDNTLKTLYMPPKVTLDKNLNNDFFVKYVKNYNSIKTPRIKRIFSETIKNIFHWDISYWDTDTIFKPKTVVSAVKIPISTFKTLNISFYTEQVKQGFAIKNIEFQKIKVKNA